jgi:hypothetical protein
VLSAPAVLHEPPRQTRRGQRNRQTHLR